MRLDYEILQQADFALSKCGRVLPPERGVSALDIPHTHYFQDVIADERTQQRYLEITGEHSFFWRAISGVPPASPIFIQIKFPNGHFFQATLREITQMCGVGSNRYNLDREIECPPGSKIWFTADNVLVASGDEQAYSFGLDGVIRVWMKSTAPQYWPREQASAMPRVWSSRNQNLMAPRWMTSDYHGEEEKYFVYSSSTLIPPVFDLPDAAAGIQLTTKIPTDIGWDFQCCRFFAKWVFTDGSDATPYIRIRDSSGYQLTDDFVNLENLSGQALPGWWPIDAGRDIILDAALVDASGSGSVTFYFFFEGFRRRR
jgi:hypothetical protein